MNSLKQKLVIHRA